MIKLIQKTNLTFQNHHTSCFITASISSRLKSLLVWLPSPATGNTYTVHLVTRLESSSHHYWDKSLQLNKRYLQNDDDQNLLWWKTILQTTCNLFILPMKKQGTKGDNGSANITHWCGGWVLRSWLPVHSHSTCQVLLSLSLICFTMLLQYNLALPSTVPAPSQNALPENGTISQLNKRGEKLNIVDTDRKTWNQTQFGRATLDSLPTDTHIPHSSVYHTTCILSRQDYSVSMLREPEPGTVYSVVEGLGWGKTPPFSMHLSLIEIMIAKPHFHVAPYW